jgi:two-component system response regulator DesR
MTMPGRPAGRSSGHVAIGVVGGTRLIVDPSGGTGRARAAGTIRENRGDLRGGGQMIQVLIAEDMRILRESLVALLELEDDLEVVAALATGADILPAAIEHRPDVAVLDIDLPGVDGLTAAAELHRRLPRCRTLILTGLARPGTLRRAVGAHVSGFLDKDAPSQELIDTIRKVAAGERVIDPTLALAALETADNPLTPREAEVLRRHAAGSSAAEIATEMHLSYGTVRNYLAAAVTKLGARNRVDAARIAERAGWL